MSLISNWVPCSLSTHFPLSPLFLVSWLPPSFFFSLRVAFGIQKKNYFSVTFTSLLPFSPITLSIPPSFFFSSWVAFGIQKKFTFFTSFLFIFPSCFPFF